MADCTDECKRQDYTNRQATVPYNIESFRPLFLHRFNLPFFGNERAVIRECEYREILTEIQSAKIANCFLSLFHGFLFSHEKHDGPKINSIWNLYTRDDAIITTQSSLKYIKHSQYVSPFSNILVLHLSRVFFFYFLYARVFLKKLRLLGFSPRLY